MVVAQIPLWIQHSTGSGESATLPLSKPQEGQDQDQDHEQDQDQDQPSKSNKKSLISNSNSNPWAKTHTRRSAIYSVDMASSSSSSGNRFATGGGDGKVRIWSITSLFATSKTAAEDTKSKSKSKSGAKASKTTGKSKSAGTSKTAGADKEKVQEKENEKEKEKEKETTAKSNETSNENIEEKEKDAEKKNQDGTNDDEEEASAPPQSLDADADGDGDGDADMESSINTHNTRGSSRKKEKIEEEKAQSKTKSESENNIESSTKQQQRQRRMARFSSKGGYDSSDSSGDSSNDDDGGDGGDHSESDNDNDEDPGGAEQSSTSRLLCTLSSHSGSVLSLRFSTSGTILASAGDDALVLLYHQTSTPSIVSSGNLLGNTGAGAGAGKDVEHWERIRICRGHNLDVVGLCWAPDDSHLISCSLDSDAPICVWKMDLEEYDEEGGHGDAFGNGNGSHIHSLRNGHGHRHGPRGSNISTTATILQPYKILGIKEHTSTVKGVAFDPAGKYIASSGDDPSLCIWRAFDDWGLESRIDSTSGIFQHQDNVQSLTNMSMFRRISFAPDGSHVCATNAQLRKKNIAAMVSREGWGVSVGNATSGTGAAATGINGGNGKSSSSNSNGNSGNIAGAANLVGHKQPVVSSRHCPYFFQVKKESTKENKADNGEKEKDNKEELEYSTLVALGDKKGFLTIWSTKKSRPIFKLQCSESRCTVTDIAWGLMPSVQNKASRSLVMLVSLLDGFTVALRFDTERELGTILSTEQVHSIFRVKYGIELTALGGAGSSRRRLVDDSSGPKIIENILQYNVEEDESDAGDNSNADDDMSIQGGEDHSDGQEAPDKKIKNTSHLTAQSQQPQVNVLDVRKKQVESRSRTTGKKRIQPVLMTMNGGLENTISSTSANTKEASEQLLNPAKRMRESPHPANGEATSYQQSGQTSVPSSHHQATTYSNVPVVMQQSATSIPASNHKIYTVNLVIPKKTSVFDEEGYDPTSDQSNRMVASCINSIQSPPGGTSMPCATITINRGRKVTWREHLLGAHCTTLDACSSMLALGSYDGTIYLYTTSPSLGWESGIGFHSHPPFVMGGSIVRLSLKESEPISRTDNKSGKEIEMLVVTSDGAFCVYSVLPFLKLKYKGSILPPMNQMRLSTSLRSSQKKNDSSAFPELSRILLTESKHLLLILCHKAKASASVGGILQGFVYNRDMEAWMRVSDGRFMFSKLFSTVPGSKFSKGTLAKIDHVVRTAPAPSNSNRRGVGANANASAMYYINEDDESSLQTFCTRSHCQDRLACALALKSKPDVDHWLRLYVRSLCVETDTVHLRLLVDMLLVRSESSKGASSKCESIDDSEVETFPCWWLSSAASALELDCKEVVEKIVISEMTKNRALQRLTNEFANELKLS